MTPVIKLQNLSRSYGTLKALDGVNLSVERGELFGIIGPDGAGKSTLYKILATLLSPSAGSATVLGLDTVADYRRLRTLIGYMPQRFSLYPDMSVEENLNFFASLFGVSVHDNFDLIAPIFGQLQKYPRRMAGQLSGGMKQKLALSCALIHRPEILLLDEPTTGVDAVSRSEFWDMLADLRRSGITVVVSTSYMDEAERCDRIAMIDHGRILETGLPASLAAGLDGILYSATASDMFRLLSLLRAMPGVTDCYTFGATLHLEADGSFNPRQATDRLIDEGLHDVHIAPARGDIEDLFIKLTRNDS